MRLLVISDYIPNCLWTYNCGAEDYDFIANWGNLIIQRNDLRYVKLILNFYTQLDGWIQISEKKTPSSSTSSEPFTFLARLHHVWCKSIENCVQNYFGIKYKFNTSLFILSGKDGLYLDEEYIFNSDNVSTNLKFCKTDHFYDETGPSCTQQLPNC